MIVTIPTLETSRLRLRAHSPEDLEVCVALWSNPVVTQYIGGRPLTREEVWARLLRYVGHWNWLGFGYWLVEDRISRKFVGEIGIAELQRDIHPPLSEGPEAGWVLAPEAHGMGLATESLQAVTAWYATRAPAQAITCMIHPENTASIKVATKCGFSEARRTLYKGSPTVVFVRPPSFGT